MKSPARPPVPCLPVLRERLELVLDLLGQPHSRQGLLTLW